MGWQNWWLRYTVVLLYFFNAFFVSVFLVCLFAWCAVFVLFYFVIWETMLGSAWLHLLFYFYF
jgi:hypothetical protein